MNCIRLHSKKSQGFTWALLGRLCATQDFCWKVLWRIRQLTQAAAANENLKISINQKTGGWVYWNVSLRNNFASKLNLHQVNIKKYNENTSNDVLCTFCFCKLWKETGKTDIMFDGCNDAKDTLRMFGICTPETFKWFGGCLKWCNTTRYNGDDASTSKHQLLHWCYTHTGEVCQVVPKAW